MTRDQVIELFHEHMDECVLPAYGEDGVLGRHEAVAIADQFLDEDVCLVDRVRHFPGTSGAQDLVRAWVRREDFTNA